jgi:hypothetical protein
VLPLNPRDASGLPFMAIALFAGDPQLLMPGNLLESEAAPSIWLEDDAAFSVARQLYALDALEQMLYELRIAEGPISSTTATAVCTVDSTDRRDTSR